MVAVVWVALGVGGATVLGTLVGFFFRNNIIKHSNTVNAFASGLMLVAAMAGLIIPARDDCGILLCSERKIQNPQSTRLPHQSDPALQLPNGTGRISKLPAAIPCSS